MWVLDHSAPTVTRTAFEAESDGMDPPSSSPDYTMPIRDKRQNSNNARILIKSSEYVFKTRRVGNWSGCHKPADSVERSLLRFSHACRDPLPLFYPGTPLLALL